MVDERKIAATRQLNLQISNTESRNALEVLNSRPLRISVDLSNACNVNCIFCLAKGYRRKQSDPEAFRSADMLDRYDPLLPFMQRVIFSSFESIIAPEFTRAVEKVSKWYTPFNIFTNGLALTPELSEFCLSNGLSTMNCSVHGADRETYEGIMRGSDFDTVVSNLMHLKLLAKKINPSFALTLVFCAMRRNIEQLPDYIELAHSVGAKAVQVNYLLVTSDDTGLEHESVFFHQDLYDRCIRRAKAKAAARGIALHHQPVFEGHQVATEPAPCYRPWEHLIVGNGGDVQVCCGGAKSPGNFFEDDFYSLWNSTPFQVFRRRVNSDNPPKACRECSRGREDPLDPRNHLTYLKKMKKSEQRKRLNEIVKDMKSTTTVSIPAQPQTVDACRL